MYNCQRNVVERAMSSSKDVQLSRISLYEIKDLSVL